jgi:hypothetical protein
MQFEEAFMSVANFTFSSNASSIDHENSSMAYVKKDGHIIVSGNGKEAHDFLRRAIKLEKDMEAKLQVEKDVYLLDGALRDYICGAELVAWNRIKTELLESVKALKPSHRSKTSVTCRFFGSDECDADVPCVTLKHSECIHL